MQFFRGIYHHNIDDKGRLSVPGKYRDVIRSLDDQRLMLTRGTDDCLALYTMPEWSKLEEQIYNHPSSDSRDAFVRIFLAPGVECTLDKIGRILIPANLRASHGIKTEVTLVGGPGKIEIWDRQRFEEYQAQSVKVALDFRTEAKISF